MFKIFVTTKFSERVVNYAPTDRELDVTMRNNTCKCVAVHAMLLKHVKCDSEVISVVPLIFFVEFCL